MEDKILETVVSSFVSELISNGKIIFSELIDEGNALLKTGINNYLVKQQKRYAFLKTLLKGNTPVYIYDIYYPLRLTNFNDKLETNNVSNLFNNSNFITVIGDAGSGKSTLVKHLFLNSIRIKYAIPIMIELRYLNEKECSLKDYIIEKLSEDNISDNTRIIDRLLSSGKFIFFLDGFDELNSSRKQKVATEINKFSNKYCGNKYILTSRPYSNIENIQHFHNYFIQKLSSEEGDINGFILKQLSNEKELANKIIDSVTQNTSEHIQSFLENPLLLSLYILTFQSNASIPNKKFIFYRRVINALFSEHDSKTKLGYVREKISGLNQDQIEEVLTKFCFLSYFESKFDWDFDYIQSQFKKIEGRVQFTFSTSKIINDLKSAICLWVEDNGVYGFAHRSLQEYFAALLISNLNIHDKKRMYEKIVDKFTRNQVNEYNNFLLLLEEMDTLCFNKYYSLPLLQELRKEINNNGDSELALSFIKFFITAIRIPEKHAITDNHPLKINQGSRLKLNRKKIDRTMFFHLPFTRKLYTILIDPIVNNHNKILKCNEFKKQPTKNELFPHRELSVPDDVPQFLLDKFYEKSLPVCKEFDEFISISIENANKLIKNNEETDRELVDLI